MFFVKKSIIELNITGKNILWNKYLWVKSMKKSKSGANARNARSTAIFLSTFGYTTKRINNGIRKCIMGSIRFLTIDCL